MGVRWQDKTYNLTKLWKQYQLALTDHRIRGSSTKSLDSGITAILKTLTVNINRRWISQFRDQLLLTNKVTLAWFKRIKNDLYAYKKFRKDISIQSFMVHAITAVNRGPGERLSVIPGHIQTPHKQWWRAYRDNLNNIHRYESKLKEEQERQVRLLSEKPEVVIAIKRTLKEQRTGEALYEKLQANQERRQEWQKKFAHQYALRKRLIGR